MNSQPDLRADEQPAASGGAASRWSVRTFLVLLVVACLLPGIIGAGVLFFYEYREGRLQLEKDTLQTARALSQAVDNQILRVEALALGLATAGSLARGDFSSFHGQAREVLKRAKLAASVVLVDRTGWQVLNTLKEFGEPLPFNGNPELMRRVFETGEPVVSDLYIGAVMRRLIMTVAVPVVIDGEVVYVLITPIRPEKFNAILNAQGLPAGWVASVLDGTGTIAGRTTGAEEFVGTQSAPEFRRRFLAIAEGAMETISTDGAPVLSVFASSPLTHWGVCIDIPRRELEAPLRHRLLMLAGGIAVPFSIGLALAWFMGEIIARSFRALVAPSMALGAGEPVSLSKVAVKEAVQVTEALGEAAKLLGKRSAALHEANQTLKESEYRLALALKAGGAAAWEMDVATLQLMSVDESLCTKLGYAPGEMTTASEWLSRIHDGDRPALEKMVAAVIEGRRENFWAEQRLRAKDGTWRWVLSQGMAAERDAEGRATRLVGIHTDITARKEAEAEIQRLNAELEQRVQMRTAQLEEANEALIRSNMELQHFAHATAHDLKTPLRSIVSFAQLLQQSMDGKADEQAQVYSAQVIDNTKRLQTLIDNLLSYTRLEAQGLPLEPVDLQGLVDRVVASLSVLIQETGAEVLWAGLPIVAVDHVQIAQVFQNLIENGIKYNQAKPPRVSIAAERQDHEWVFSVTDNGIGIDPRHHERIFEIFRRLHTYSQVQGSGIGLALCRRIIERHGGRIWVESRLGEGSSFYFTLPVRMKTTGWALTASELPKS